MKRHCLTLDLKDNPQLIAEYEEYHKKIWPEIEQSIREAGIDGMEIYRFGTRMFMIMDVSDSFDFSKKSARDALNPIVQEWENLMWKYQQPLPQAKPGEKWMLMDKIFDLNQ